MFVPGKLFQHSLMFAGKAGDYPSEAPFRCVIQLSVILMNVPQLIVILLSVIPVECHFD